MWKIKRLWVPLIYLRRLPTKHFTRRIFFPRPAFVGFSTHIQTVCRRVYITAVPEVVMAEPDTTSFANVQLWNCYKPQFYEIRNVHDILPGRETMTQVSYSAQHYSFYFRLFPQSTKHAAFLWSNERFFNIFTWNQRCPDHCYSNCLNYLKNILSIEKYALKKH